MKEILVNPSVVWGARWNMKPSFSPLHIHWITLEKAYGCV